MHRTSLWLAGLVGAGILCATVGADFWASRWTSHQREEQSRLEAITASLDLRLRTLDGTKAQLESIFLDLSRHRSEISGLRKTIAAVEKRYPKTIPQEVYPKYERTLKTHNALVVEYARETERYATLYADYTASMEQYNQMALEAHGLARRIGKTWCVASIPSIGMGAL